MKSINLNKGQIGIPILMAFGAVTAFFVGWDSWLSNRVISVSEQGAATIEWQKGADKNFDEIKDSIKELNSKIDLISPRLGVNTHILLGTTTHDF